MLETRNMGPSISNYDKYKVDVEKVSENMMFLADVLFALKISRATLYKRIAEGKVPKPVDYYNGKSVWRRDQIEACVLELFAKFR